MPSLCTPSKIIYLGAILSRLQYLRGWWRRKLSPEDTVPEPARHSEAILIVHEVVLEVVLLELAIVGG